MKVILRKNIKTDGGETLEKGIEGYLVAVHWTDTQSESFYTEIKTKRYMLSKNDIEIIN